MTNASTPLIENINQNELKNNNINKSEIKFKNNSIS